MLEEQEQDHPAVDDAEFRRAMRWGVLFWLLFCVVAVLIRGVRWDETFEHAQVITGQAPYPEGHPLRVYVRGAFSLQTYASAAALALGAGPALVCGARNVLFLLGTVLPVFLLCAILSRRAIWGHVAARLLLEGIMLEFDGSYPTFVWPELYSNGHIGGAMALLTLIALVSGRLGWAAFLFGLMPCIHIGQWPILLALFPWYAVALVRRREYRTILRATCFLLAGAGGCIAFYFIQRGFIEPLPASGPFAAQDDPASIWKAYTALFDPHRRFPPGNGHIVLAGMLLLSGLAAWRERDVRMKWIYGGLFLYTEGVAAAVWGIMAIHALYGPNVPFLLIAWMPYRLINHIPSLCLAVIIAVLCRRRQEENDALSLLAAGALLFGVVHPWLRPLIGAPMYNRYVAAGDAVAFILYGAAVMRLVLPWRTLPPWMSVLVLFVPVILLGTYHQFGAACVFTGFILTLLLRRLASPRPESPRLAVIASVVCLLVTALLLGHQGRYRQWLPIPEFDRQVAAHLAERGESGAMLVVPPEDSLRQAHTGHPVLAEVATPSLISYRPEIGPAIARIYADIYAIRFVLPPAESPSWETVWKRRPTIGWQMLGTRYGFRYVIAPADLPLHLSRVLADESNVLYKIPDVRDGE